MDSEDDYISEDDWSGDEDEISDDDMMEEPQSALEKKNSYDLIQRDDIYDYMKSIITELAIITGIRYTILRALLNRYKWDKDGLLERYYDDPKELFISNNIPYIQDEEGHRPDDAECQICCEIVQSQHLLGSICQHYFCKDCIRLYCKETITAGGKNCIECPGDCRAYIDDTVILELFNRPGNSTDKKVARLYKKLMVDAFVKQNRAMMYCTTADCDVIIKMKGPDRSGIDKFALEINCNCGEILCSSCSNPWHDPVQCSLLNRWKKKCDDDSETFNWIHANTKECPHCQATIEKDGGCNHVVCRNASCRYEFCWVCLGSWKAHGSSFYNCNRYNETDSTDARHSQEQSRANLERYLFYYNRYHNHSQSLKFEHRIRKKVEAKMNDLVNRDMSWVEVQFLKAAVDILRKSRQCLMFTYVFAFYLKPTNSTLIFEQNQANLESATEALSEFLERDLPDSFEDLGEIKRNVQDKARFCDERSKRLIEHVHEGYTQEFWQYRNLDI